MGQLIVAVTLLCCFATLGCNSSGRAPTYPVSGTVMMNGQPLEGAAVVFVPTEGATGQEAAAAVTDAEGKYALRANLGEYRIKVSKFDGKKPSKEEQERYISYEEEQKIQFAADEKPTPPARNLLPPKYGDETTSGIIYTVAKGSNTFDIKMP